MVLEPKWLRILSHSTGRGTRLVLRNDECARIVARCTWRVGARHVDIHVRGHLAQIVVRLLALFSLPTL